MGKRFEVINKVAFGYEEVSVLHRALAFMVDEIGGTEEELELEALMNDFLEKYRRENVK